MTRITPLWPSQRFGRHGRCGRRHISVETARDAWAEGAEVILTGRNREPSVIAEVLARHSGTHQSFWDCVIVRALLSNRCSN